MIRLKATSFLRFSAFFKNKKVKLELALAYESYAGENLVVILMEILNVCFILF